CGASESPRRDLLPHPAVDDRQPRDAIVAAAGNVLEVRRGDHGLSRTGPQELDQRSAPGAVQLAHHVVEQHHRRRAALLGDRLALGQQQREQPEPLLALRPERPQVAAAELRGELVSVRAVAREAPLEVLLEASGELVAEALRRRGTGAWSV